MLSRIHENAVVVADKQKYAVVYVVPKSTAPNFSKRHRPDLQLITSQLSLCDAQKWSNLYIIAAVWLHCCTQRRDMVGGKKDLTGDKQQLLR